MTNRIAVTGDCSSCTKTPPLKTEGGAGDENRKDAENNGARRLWLVTVTDSDSASNDHSI